MLLEELQEALEELLPEGFSVDTSEDGELVIYTNLTESEDGELLPLENYEDEDDEEEDEEDLEEDDEG